MAKKKAKSRYISFINRYTLNAVEKLEKKVLKNPLYPFKRAKRGELRFTTRYKEMFLYVALFSAMLVAFIFTVSVSISEFQTLFVLSTIGMVVGASGACRFCRRRTYVLQHMSGTYQFYIGKKLVVEGPLHNIYLRIGKRFTNVGLRYYVFINSYKGDKIVLSGSTDKIDGLRRVARIMAKNLDLNYFDESNNSSEHLVVHNRPGVASHSTNVLK